LDFLEQILDAHEIEDNDVETSIETLAKEYNKQDGKSFYFFHVVLKEHLLLKFEV